MTIDELIAELHRRRELHGGDTDVQVTWESTKHGIDLGDIYFGKEGCLFVDADGSFYKDSFQHPDDVKNNPST